MKRDKAREGPEIMVLKDVAEYLNCHPVTVHRLVTCGELPAFRLGSNWRFRREDIDTWVAEYEVKPDQRKPRKGR